MEIGEQAFWEMVVFIAILAFGLLYAWKKGVLTVEVERNEGRWGDAW